MSLRKTLRGICVIGALAVALVVFAAAPALATYTHVFSGSIGEAGSGDGQMELRGEAGYRGGSGVAVNASTHAVYVADTGNHRIDEFSAAGVFIRAWGWGVADGTTDALQTCTSGCHPGIAGTGAGQLNEPSYIAVDNSGGPSEGDVYVADRASGFEGSAFVVKFSSSGGYLSTNDGIAAITPIAGPFGQTIYGIAVSGSGDLWVYDQPPGVGFPDMFEFAQDGSFVTDWEGQVTSHRSVGVAIDSANDLYVGFRKFTSAGAFLGEINTAEPKGVAVNSATEAVYTNERQQIAAQYADSCDVSLGAHCTPVDTFASGGELSGAEALAVDTSNDTVYAANAETGAIVAFGRTSDVTTGQPSGRTATTAVLGGSVDPDNTPVSNCQFDYVADSGYQAGEPNPYTAGGSVPCATLPAGSGPVAVHAEITGLTPGVVYHFRLQATNAYGTSFGADETVPGTPPVISSTSAADVTSISAELRASIDPEGGDTTYHFEYGATTGYGSSVPVPDAGIGSGVSDVNVAQRVQGLLAGGVYHYRVVARNSLGTTVGPDQTVTMQPVGGSTVDTCPNAAIRAVQSAAGLPDCRAYEQVSPPEKDGNPILAPEEDGGSWEASADGSAVVYTSTGVFADAQTGASTSSPYLSSRGEGGWSTHSLLPPQAPGQYLPHPHFNLFSSDLTEGILLDGGRNPSVTGQDLPAIVPGEPANNENLFLRDNLTNSYQLIDVTPARVTPAPVEVAGVKASSDLSHVFFEENAQLTADSPPAGEAPHLFEWSGGVVRLAGVLPDGAPVLASQRVEVGAVSADGSRVYFRTEGAGLGGRGAALYMRQDATSTVQVDASHGPGPGGGGELQAVSSDGSVAFFQDEASRGLTNDTVPGSGSNLYRYEADSGMLSDLTPVAGAEVQTVLGASEDGSYVYFIANGVLAPGASPGDCEGGFGSGPSETCNLYLFHDGVTTFIAALSGEDLHAVGNGEDFHGTGLGSGTASVSSDGRYLAFQSVNSLTGYENVAASGTQCGGPGSRCAEVFIYDAAAGPSGRLSCASCNPSGGAPTGPSGMPGGDVLPHKPRYLSDSGRLFFDSEDALVPQDTNGQVDVYEYEPDGVGSCQLAQSCVSLISSGTSPYPSAFRDASVSGEDVFFTTSDRLVAQDGDQSADLYDARVDGGIASQNEMPAAACDGEACKPPAAGQSGEQAPGSSDFSGAGNLVPAPSAVVVRGKPLTRAQKLAQALRVCGSKPKRKRASCVAQARRRYGPSTKKTSSSARKARRANNNRRAGR